MWIKIENFSLDSAAVSSEIDECLKSFIARFLKLEEDLITNYLICNKSIDARRGIPQIIYSIFVEVAKDLVAKNDKYTVIDKAVVDAKYYATLPEVEEVAFSSRPIIVGTGPAGIFAALTLAEKGAKPIIYDRGFDVDTRALDQEKFLETRELNTESNLLIGEGGAGTFSDGKLYTRTKDKLSSYVLRRYVEFGGSKETMYLKRPHLGSDVLPEIAKNMRNEIEKLGGEFHFGANVTSIISEDDVIKGIVLDNGEKIYSDNVIIAHGLGGRDLTCELAKRGVKYKLKSFQIGCRIEHPQLLIDTHQYRLNDRFECLPVAEYNMVAKMPAKTDLLGVSSFCMCPGGEVVMASAWKNQLTTNGMSNSKRDGEFANSCLIMTIKGERFGTIDAAYKFLTKYEKAAFLAGNEDYTLVAQSAKSFIAHHEGLCREETSSQTGIIEGRLDEIFSKDLVLSIIHALRDFDNKCHGFIEHGQLMGVETCISSPVRFNRDETTLSSSIKNLYIAGEGASYAGGIMSAAIDGIKIALAMLENNR